MTEQKEQTLEELITQVIPIITYRGCLVSKTKKGYSIFGRSCKTKEEVDTVINNYLKKIEHSIIK